MIMKKSSSMIEMFVFARVSKGLFQFIRLKQRNSLLLLNFILLSFAQHSRFRWALPAARPQDAAAPVNQTTASLALISDASASSSEFRITCTIRPFV